MKEIPVRGSIEFRDAVMSMDKEGHKVFVRRAVDQHRVYRVIASMGHITTEDLFSSKYPPVHMEDFAFTLRENGGNPSKMIVFTESN